MGLKVRCEHEHIRGRVRGEKVRNPESFMRSLATIYTIHTFIGRDVILIRKELSELDPIITMM